MSNGILYGLSFIVTITTITLGICIYTYQKKPDSVYNKIIKEIEKKTKIDSNIKQITSTMLGITVMIIGMLLIGLELSIFLPSYEWGWINRSDLLTVFATLLAGCIGLIGVVMGVISTYGAFYLGKAEQEEEKKRIKEKELKYKKQMLYSLIDQTLQSTRQQYDELEKIYAQNYTQLKIYAEEQNKKLKDYSEEDEDVFKLSKNLSSDIDDISMIATIKDIKNRNVGERILKLLEGHFKQKIVSNKSMKRGVYFDNWNDYIDCVEPGNDRYYIITWLSMLMHLDKTMSVEDFIFYRNIMFSVIKRNYPELKEYGKAYGIDSTKEGYCSVYYTMYKK